MEGRGGGEDRTWLLAMMEGGVEEDRIRLLATMEGGVREDRTRLLATMEERGGGRTDPLTFVKLTTCSESQAYHMLKLITCSEYQSLPPASEYQAYHMQRGSKLTTCKDMADDNANVSGISIILCNCVKDKTVWDLTTLDHTTKAEDDDPGLPSSLHELLQILRDRWRSDEASGS
ncbi:hypothetical protein Hamer_G025476 [Homarus americanus]|uniref:Uncharacterized protein n=1 Tax=Homarus americanus TaxID=6706 RepID=A0A8J5MRA3_HOMAM|nr:hypothetical protein Hamer_G025476 [Homarus americanus]